jgi:hypothetical protein
MCREGAEEREKGGEGRWGTTCYHDVGTARANIFGFSGCAGANIFSAVIVNADAVIDIDTFGFGCGFGYPVPPMTLTVLSSIPIGVAGDAEPGGDGVVDEESDGVLGDSGE